MKHLNLIKEIFSEGFTGLMDNAGESEKNLQEAETEFYGFMALAPEMLKMLKQMVGELDDTWMLNADVGKIGGKTKYDVKRLIAKAEGGE